MHKPSEDNRMVGKIQLNDICYVVDFSKGGKAMAVGGAEGVVYVFGIWNDDRSIILNKLFVIFAIEVVVLINAGKNLLSCLFII